MDIREFLKSEKGDSQMAAMGLILALVVVVAITALTGLGDQIVATLEEVAGAL